MLRKTVVTSALSMLINSVSWGGFYVGASVGPEGADFKQYSHVTRLGTFDVIDTNHFAGIGVFGSLFGGYGWKYQRYYLAGEVNANISSVEYELTNKEYVHSTLSKTRFTVRHSEGISILPGYFLSESTLLFGRIGFINGRIKISEADPTIQSHTKNKNGIRYGLGLQHALTPKLNLILDYSQINYQGINSSVFEPFGMVLKNTKISANTAQMGLGLIYHWDQPQPVYVK